MLDYLFATVLDGRNAYLTDGVQRALGRPPRDFRDFLMTVFGNVPMNNKLESLDHSSAQARDYWLEYGRKWTRLNHARYIGSVLTAGLYIIAAVTLITSGQVQV
jgi:hypothetical protein